jgi:hypothetical protein
MLSKWICAVTLLGVCVVGCDEGASSEAAKPAKPTASTPVTAASAKVAPTPPKAKGDKPSIKTKAKGSLDGKKAKADAKGTWLDIPGTTAQFKVPEGWTTEKNPRLAIASSKDGKTGVVATTYRKGKDPTPILGELAGALSFRDCEWSKAQDVVMGEDVPAKVADGVCMQEDTGVYVIYAMMSGEDINAFVLAGWDEDTPEVEADRTTDMLLSIRAKDVE